MRKITIVLTALLFLVNCTAGPIERIRDQFQASCDAGVTDFCGTAAQLAADVERERQERAAQVGLGILAFTGAVLLGAAMGAAATPYPTYHTYHSRTVIIRR